MRNFIFVSNLSKKGTKLDTIKKFPRNSLLAVFAIVFLSAVFSGCAYIENLDGRAMTVDDVIAMSSSGVSSDVIKSQIDATHSKYTLTPQQIIALKKAGVNDDVVKKMIESDSSPDYYDWEYGSPSYYGYGYYNWYPGYYGNYGYRPWGYRTPGMVGRFYNYYPDNHYKYKHDYSGKSRQDNDSDGKVKKENKPRATKRDKKQDDNTEKDTDN